MKKDEPVILPPQGDAQTQSLSCGSDYSKQFFYSFKKGIVHSGTVDSWHLAFDASPEGYGVFINGGIGMAIIPTGKKYFHELDLEEYDQQPWFQDDPSGKPEKSVMGNWINNSNSSSQIYLLRLDANNKKLLAIKLLSVTDIKYEFEIKDVITGHSHQCEVMKNSACTFAYYNLVERKQRLDIEPNKEDWDILFTRYGFTFYDQNPPLHYIVTGVLSNPLTEVFKDSTFEFYKIESDIIPSRAFISDRDAIGFDWKTYDFDLGIYNVRQDYNFIIRTQHDEYYKMRFLSFYDDKGVKGSPTFEYRQIQ